MQLDEYIASVGSVSLSELYHHGVEGQKWGQRNGPPYPLKESAKSSAEKSAASGGSSASGNGTESSNAKTKTEKVETKKETKSKTEDEGKKEKEKKTSTRKNAKQMSDSELKSAVDRLEMEKKYKDLKTSQSEAKSIGKDVIKSVSKNTLTNVGTQLGVYGLATFANKVLSYFINEGIYYEYVNPKKGQKDSKSK